MDPVVAINGEIAAHSKRLVRSRKSAPQEQFVEKTPESELMLEEEYFGILRKRVNDYYNGLQGQD